MYKRKLEKEIRCPLDRGFALFGGKWKPRILCVLGTSKKPMRYSELLHALGNITDAVLSATLRELTEDGLTVREAYAEIPPRVEYSLTEHGRSVLPILHSIAVWAGAAVREMPDEASPHCLRCDIAEAGPDASGLCR